MQPLVDTQKKNFCDNRQMVTVNSDKERGERIAQAIENSDYSRADLARRIGVKPQAVTKWCQSGKISRTNLLALSAYTQIDATYLETGHQPKYDPSQRPQKPPISTHKLSAAIYILIREHGVEVMELPTEQLSELIANEYNSIP